MDASAKHKITRKQLPPGKQYINPKNITYIEEEIGYWRKANAIHNYFVRTCQDGIDDCRETQVDDETLTDLLNACKNILKAKKENWPELKDMIKEALPPTSEFFSGSTEIDEWYFKDLENTVKIIEGLEKKVRKIFSGEEVEYYAGEIIYSSSW